MRECQHTIAPSSRPLTPSPTDKATFVQSPRVIALFKDIEARRNQTEHPSRIESQLIQGEYDEIEWRLRQDRLLHATLSMWRTQLSHTTDRDELRVFQEVTNQVGSFPDNIISSHLISN